jgi:hypothetical protein
MGTINFDLSHRIKFNCWKHHKKFLIRQILSIEPDDEVLFKNFLSHVKEIGNSKTDLYTGLLSPSEIYKMIIKKLENFNVKNKSTYKEWLSLAGKDYEELKLEDNSKWILRFGTEENKFIHIHPSRDPLHSIRVNASTLKTTIVALAFSRLLNYNEINLNLINKLRKEILLLAPLKSLKPPSSVINLIEEFGYIRCLKY